MKDINMNNNYNRKVPTEFKMKDRKNQKQQWYDDNSAQDNETNNEEPANLEPIVKNIYKPSANNGKHKPAEVSKWISANQITLNGENVPTPIFTFDESTFPEVMKKLLCKNYEKPTPIQSISWPVALSGFDLISIAKTGSGKTLGFILPAIVHVVSQKSRNSRDGPTVVVLLPTRELAQQVEQVAQEYCKAMRIGLVCVYGGAPKGPQVGNLKRGADIVIATPGRLLDFMDTFLSMARCSFLVMDEADRMLDMGFEPQIRRIAGQIRKDRQTLMFSATWPPEVRKLARDFQQNPVNLTVGSLELAANHNIEQNVEVMNEYRKPERLNELLSHIMQQEEKKTIIFVATKKKADDLHRNVRQQGYSALCIHGDKDQSERNWVLNQFKQGKVFFLFATDVAARGIDVSDIKFVINYDFPNNSEDYVHRIGRTGRRDQQGTAFTFFTDNDNGKASSLVKVLEEAKQNVPEALAAAASMNYGRSGGNWSNRKRNWYGNGGGGNGYGGQSKRTKFDDNDWPKKSASKQFGNNSWKEQGGTQNGNWKGKFDDNEWPKKSASKQFGNNSWNKEQGGEQNGNWKGKNGWQSNGQGQAQSRW